MYTVKIGVVIDDRVWREIIQQPGFSFSHVKESPVAEYMGGLVGENRDMDTIGLYEIIIGVICMRINYRFWPQGCEHALSDSACK